jgi:hypothetical protein
MMPGYPADKFIQELEAMEELCLKICTTLPEKIIVKVSSCLSIRQESALTGLVGATTKLRQAAFEYLVAMEAMDYAVNEKEVVQ